MIMETTANVTFGKVNSASIEVNNSGDAGRRYGITASVDMSDGKVTNLYNGIVVDLDNNQHLASFGLRDDMGSGRFSITYQDDTCDRVAVFEDVNDFFDAAMGKEVTMIAE